MKKSQSNLLFEQLIQNGKPSKTEMEINQHEKKDTFFLMILNEGSVLTINLNKLDAPFES